MKHVHRMPFGASFHAVDGCRFRIWAPAASDVQLVLDGKSFPCPPAVAGWWSATLAADRGSRYHWLVDGTPVPDPASRSNPEGPHRSSEVVDPSEFEWTCAWSGRPWDQTIAYQVHIGSFTPEGSFAAAADRLPDLAALGITAIQLMPVATSSGAFGWGYDGVLIYAPNPNYGTPNDLKAFVDRAHQLGLMVFLDVVYNHFGPDGNFLPSYAPSFESSTHETGWGKAVNFDGEGAANVREFIIQNAIYWLEEFQFDGLRLDAVHAMVDDSPTHIVEALTRRAHAMCPGRHVHIILENDHNNPRRLGFPADLCEGQWNGDFHHCLHVLMTGESSSYYSEYVDDPVGRLARVLTLGFSRAGAEEARRDRRPRHDATSTISLVNAVDFLQCHDQVGNRAFGERLNALSSVAAQRLASALLLLSPSIPMLFMGEEFGSHRPFLYFADVPAELQEALRAGRRQEFKDGPDHERAQHEEAPDPCSRDSFLASKLETPDSLDGGQRATRDWTRRLLHLRQQALCPHLRQLGVGTHRFIRHGASGLRIDWDFGEGRVLRARVNLAGKEVPWPDAASREGPAAAPLLTVGTVSDEGLGAWSGTWCWSTEDE